MENWIALTVPFLGTAIGAAAVLGLRQGSQAFQRGMSGFAGGAMMAASFCSLLLPGMAAEGGWTIAGFLLGIWAVMGTERLAQRTQGARRPELVLLAALVIHNIPEGLAVGIGEGEVGTVLGIALQNIPDGAVASVPLAALGMHKDRAFLLGVLTGAVEPLAALAAMELGRGAEKIAPGLMGFAAGAMGYVVIRELIPRMDQDQKGVLWYGLGTVMILGLGMVT